MNIFFGQRLEILVSALIAAISVACGAYICHRAELLSSALRAEDLSTVIVARQVLPSGVRLSVSGGMLQTSEDRFMSARSFEQLRRMGEIDFVSAIEVYPWEFADLSSQERHRLDLIAVSPGFLQKTGFGSAATERQLAAGQLLLDQDWARRNKVISEGDARVSVPAWISTLISSISRQSGKTADDPSLVLQYRSESMKLPKGFALFSNAGFIQLDHPDFVAKGLSNQGRLWIKLKPGVNEVAALTALRSFFDSQAELTYMQSRIEVQPLRNSVLAPAIRPETVSQWRQRMDVVSAVGGGLVLTVLALVRWGDLRRELALRLALGQHRSLALRQVATQVLRRMAAGVVGGSLVATLFSAFYWNVALTSIAAELPRAAIVAIFAWGILAVLLHRSGSRAATMRKALAVKV